MQLDTSYLGKIVKISYVDAFYSYIDVVDKNIDTPPPIVSVGRLVRIEDDFIDLSFAWMSMSLSERGIVVPRKSIVTIEKITVYE